MFEPRLEFVERDGIRLLTDAGALDDGLVVAFSDRVGGVSASPFDTLNLALRVGDDRARVEENRRLVAAAAGINSESIALARQVHGLDLMEVAPARQTGVVGEADGLVARSPGVTLGILTADCAAVVLAGERAVGIVHAGWRGLVAGVVERGVEAVGPVSAAWVGPSIHACCYEVGPEVVDAFQGAGLPVADDRHVDPGRAATFALHRAGVGRVAASDECTSCSERFFSYRRDGLTGRQGAFVGMLR